MIENKQKNIEVILIKKKQIYEKLLKSYVSDLENITVTLWDVIPLSMFIKERAEIPYSLRWENLQHRHKQSSFRKIKLIPTSLVSSMDEATSVFENYLSQGLEGGILKDPNGIWEDKRSQACIKFKGELDCDLICVDWERGTGKNSQRLGALVLESADGKVRTSVGSGFTDEDRDTITKDIIGKIITVKYNARITKKDSDIDSLFLPVFLEIRSDKSEADSSNKIK